MLLKKLEICGFKSFPDLVELKFDKGITVIVGPNGCGKTNILDSIRWVLGEQSSKMLRGREMTDLIFTGGADKKPKGMAEVSLTLLDTDGILPTEYSEVTITRRLFRSAESEYLLNRNACRLKDIQELFMDTGLGADTYSIIEQSQTDLILSNNPALRRSLFEEAAGITKYKARKKETLRKLETTEQNLLRIYDIVAEVKHQMNSLKRQAGRAERYKKFHDERQGLELKLDSFYFYGLEQKRSKCREDLTGMQDEREGALARISGCEAEIEKLDLEAMQLEDKLSSIYESRKDFFEKVGGLTKEIAEIEERLKGKDFRWKMLTREIEEDGLKLKELESDMVEKRNKKGPGVLETLLRKIADKINELCSECKRKMASMKDDVERINGQNEAPYLELERRLKDVVIASKEKILTKTNEIALIKKTMQEEAIKLEEKKKHLECVKSEDNKDGFDRGSIEKKGKELRLSAKQIGDKIREERYGLRTLEENIAGLQVKEAELRVQQESLQQKMQDVYKCSCPAQEELENMEEIKSRIEYLRGEMERIGLVNMMALDEYKEIEERFNFLSVQQKDLEDAKGNLNDTISKIDKESIERFKSTFDKTREHFALIFGKFFKGGRADIVLTGDDVLESDIEIIAQPPGKKPESIQLLSGGERALTAIGLLFSIFMVKPSPFLILDEVDAPLDDPNIRRFTEVVREFSKNTQFIVITHNKRTMEIADCLYGITMEEPGVSKVVSVSFKKEEHAERNVEAVAWAGAS